MSKYSAQLITYPGSKYDWKLLTKVIDKYQIENNENTVTVHNSNAYSLSCITVFDLIFFYLQTPLLQFQWEKYMSLTRGEKNWSFRIGITTIVRVFLRTVQLPGMIIGKDNQKYKHQVLRILNISASHLAAWKSALSSGAEFALILEDDGHLSSAIDLVSTLNYISNTFGNSGKILIDISDSFSFGELGVEHLIKLERTKKVSGTPQLAIDVEFPFTNTVCATVISKTLLSDLCNFLENSLNSRLTRSIPIDWQLNRYISTSQNWQNLKCVHLSPGVVRQGSLK